MSGVQSVARVAREIGPAPLMLALNFIINVASRVLARIPIISVLGAGFVAFKKIAKPWYDNRVAGAEWERQRENEKYMADHDDHTDDFFDSNGKARSYFQRNRIAILRYLSGEQEHDEGSYNWYQKWEEWAREQYEKQRQAAEEAQRAYERASGTGYQRQRREQESYRRQQQQWQRERTRTAGGTRQQQAKKKPEYVWEFNPNDPYSVLGLKRGATKSEVSQAFRREMLKYHPDTQVANATDAEKDRALERSKLITEAYRKIKAQMK
jgi:DnaJ-domain-containing protein 1